MAIKKLRGKKSCYVLITCDTPNEMGQMQVKMSYEGDLDLAALMVDQASLFFQDARDEQSLIKQMH